MAVNPLIAALGWDTFNPDEVDREYSVPDHVRVRFEPTHDLFAVGIVSR